ncbi:MAG: dTMP kinase [Caldilineaceae bacterium]|nr:dTMP kinase [Caldilineaceae bacterium]
MTLFITFEGPEGSGKTTQVGLLSEALIDKGWSVLATREPGGTRIGNAIRNLLLDVDHTEISARAETLLFNAARAQIVDQVIRPALDAGQIVLCDRYADSTLAYQGYGHGQNLDELGMLIHYATAGLTPHLTIYLDVVPEDGLRRKRNADTPEWNRLDAKQLAFHQAVRAGYLQLAAADPKRWLVIDTTQDVMRVHAQILAEVKRRLGKRVEEQL